MRCNPWRWLWGLLPVLVWTWITVLGEHERIETDLRSRAEEALAKNGLSWANSAFSGRDGVVSGRALEEGEPTQAIDVARRVWGVRVVDGRTELIDKADTYLWSAALRDNQVKLSGFVPNEQTRKAILGVVKAHFPRADVDDKMKLARGVPSRESWLGGIAFGVKQLAALRRGTVDLNNLDLSVAGEANDFASFKGVKTALQAMPQSVRLAGDKVTPPVVNPYTWSAKVTGSQLVLSGHVPSDKLREDVFGQAKKTFPKLAIVDRMEMADGAPEGWARGVLASLNQLTQLKEGSADMIAGALKLAGTATDEAAAEDIRKAWRADVPQSFKLSDNIQYPKIAAAPAPISPYVTTIDAGAGAIDLTGYVPNESARAALLAAVKARFAGRTINDRLQVGAGAPDGWQPCLISAVDGLGRLGGGRAGLTDRRLDLVGQTDNEALSGSLPGEVKAAAGAACDANVRITLLTVAPPPPKVDVEAERRAAEDAARRKAEADRAAAEKAAADRAAAEKAAADRAAAEKAAADERARVAALDAKRREADRCQQSLRSAAAEGVIQFKRASADLEAASIPTLNRLAGVANACPAAQIEIEGHTDAEGTPERNARLSQRRAQAVVDFLTKAGVNAARLSANGYGETRPVAPNDTAENRAKNRRIEFAVKAD